MEYLFSDKNILPALENSFSQSRLSYDLFLLQEFIQGYQQYFLRLNQQSQQQQGQGYDFQHTD